MSAEAIAYLEQQRRASRIQTLSDKGLREKFLDIVLDRLPADTTATSALAKELA